MESKEEDAQKLRVAVVANHSHQFGLARRVIDGSTDTTVRMLRYGHDAIEDVHSWGPDIVLIVTSTAALMAGASLVPVLSRINHTQGSIDVAEGRPVISEPVPAQRPLRRARNLMFEDLMFDRDTRTLYRKDRLASLSSRESLLLITFLENPEAVVMLKQFQKTAWANQHCNLKNLRVHMHNLRMKVDHRGERRLIHTVRGSGYILSANLAGPEALQIAP